MQRGACRRHLLFLQDETNDKFAERSDIGNEGERLTSPSGCSPASQVRDPQLSFDPRWRAAEHELEDGSEKPSCVNWGRHLFKNLNGQKLSEPPSDSGLTG